MTPCYHLHRCLAATMLVSGLLASRHAESACPVSSMTLLDVPVTSTESVRDTAVSTDRGSARGSYDLPLGALSVTSLSFGETGDGDGFVDTHDDYWVVGVAPGTPLTFTARLTLRGEGTLTGPSAGYLLGAWVHEGEDNHQFFSRDNLPVAETLELTIQKAAGEIFHLSHYVRANHYADGSASMSATLSFAGLPPGASVVSCQGYTSDPGVPVRSTTWGTVKLRYR